MKRLIIVLFSVFLLSAHAQANDPYWDGYDDAKEGQGDWSTNENYNDYMDGYEDAQRQRETEERIEREHQEREERRRQEQEQRNRNQNWLND